jgi:hypothetical protein
MHKFLSHPKRLFFYNAISLGFYTKQIQKFPHALPSLGDTQSLHDMSHHHTLNQHHYILLTFTYSPTTLECGCKTCNTRGWPGSQRILKSLQYTIGKRNCTRCVPMCAPCSKHTTWCAAVFCEKCADISVIQVVYGCPTALCNQLLTALHSHLPLTNAPQTAVHRGKVKTTWWPG